jgi:hypothetical protein
MNRRPRLGFADYDIVRAAVERLQADRNGAAKGAIFSTDIRAIDRCDDSRNRYGRRVIDEGACFELGYAYSRGKICLEVRTDVRSLLPVGDNPMIDCALRKIFRDVDSACDWIRRRQWEQHISCTRSILRRPRFRDGSQPSKRA